MRLSKNKMFDSTAIYHNGNHYFPYADDVEISGDKLSIQACFYSPARRKWFQDAFYSDNKQFIRELYDFAVVKNLISEYPKKVLDYLK